MDLSGESLYPLYIAASVDRYALCFSRMAYFVPVTGKEMLFYHFPCCTLFILFMILRVVWILLVKIYSSQEPVAKRGEELLKKKASGTNMDDPKLINRLFLLFNGT